MTVSRTISLSLCCCALWAEDGVDAAAEPTVENDVRLAAGYSPLGDVLFIDEDAYVEAVSRRRQELSAAPQAVTVIDYGGEYAQAPWTIPDRLRYEAGVDVYQSRHGQYDVGIRGWNGIGTSRTLVMANDREIILEQIGLVPWTSHIHLSDVQRIEVVKGPSSVTYGANAFGGVIAMSDRAVGDVHEVHGIGSVGDDGLLELDGTALGPIHGLGVPVTYKVSVGGNRRDDLDGHRGIEPDGSNTRGEDTGDADVESFRASATIGVEFLPSYQAELSYSMVDLQTWEIVEDLTMGSNHIDFDDRVLDLRVTAPFGEIRWLHKEQDRYYGNQKSTYDPVADMIRNYLYTRIDLDDVSDSLRLQLSHEISGHVLTGGGEFHHWESTSNFWASGGIYGQTDTYETVDYDNIAVFAEDQWQPNERWVFNAGIRYDDHSVVGDNWSPRIAVNYRVDENEFYRLSYSSGYRLPNPFELFIDEFYFAVDDDLDVETVDSIDVGWSKDWDAYGFHTTLGGFFSRAENLIAFWPLDEAEMKANWDGWLTGTGPGSGFEIPPGPFFEYTNIDNGATVFGLEAEYQQGFHGRRGRLWANVTWQHFAYDDPIRYQSDGFTDILSVDRFVFDYQLGDQVNAPPEWKANLGVQYSHRGWFGSAAIRYVDDQEFFSFASTDFSNASGGPRLALSKRDAFAALDLSLGYNWGSEDGLRRFVRLSVLDAFDSGHYESYELGSAVLAANNEWQRASEIGRSWALTSGWEF